MRVRVTMYRQERSRQCALMLSHCGRLWKWVMLSLVYASCSVTTHSWTIVNMLSLVSASCIVTTHSWPILNFPLLVPISSWSQFQLVTCSQFQLVVRLYALIVTFPCGHFVHTFAPRKRHLRCGIYTPSTSTSSGCWIFGVSFDVKYRIL